MQISSISVIKTTERKADIYYSGYIQTHCQKHKKIKRADQILPEVYGTTLSENDTLLNNLYRVPSNSKDQKARHASE